MNANKEKRTKRIARRRRIRAKIKGIKECPRISVFRSNKHIYGQLIDDGQGKTIASICDIDISKKKDQNANLKTANQVGQALAEKAKQAGIKKAVFDRGGYKYHGQVKALADGAREAGLKL